MTTTLPPRPPHDTFLFCDNIFICCRAGVASCLSETNQTTSQTGGLNRKGDNIASNPASCITLKPPSKKQLVTSTPKAMKTILPDPWLPVPKGVTSSHQNSKSDHLPCGSKASVKTIYLPSTFRVFQSLGNTIVSNAILKPPPRRHLASLSTQGQVSLRSPCYTYSDFFILSTPSLPPRARWMWIPRQLG